MSTTRRTFTGGLTACAAAAVLPALPAKATPFRRAASPSAFWRFDLSNGGIVSRGPGEPPPQILRAVQALLEQQPPFNGVLAAPSRPGTAKMPSKSSAIRPVRHRPRSGAVFGEGLAPRRRRGDRSASSPPGPSSCLKISRGCGGSAPASSNKARALARTTPHGFHVPTFPLAARR